MSTEASDYQWYELVQGSDLQQGDFLNDFPLLIQPDSFPISPDELERLSPEGQPITIDKNSTQIYNVVIMTQSCDFNKMQDADIVTICPRFEYRDLYGKDRWKPLREGRMAGAHLLNKCDLIGFEFEYQVVDLTKIFGVSYSFLKKVAESRGNRIRLLPPYREHLAQAFAKRFMRVGLPIDLPPDYPY